ncbi:MAG: transporter [Fimbriimonadaceae bacterium]
MRSLVLVVILAPGLAFAQTSAYPISTDRPSFSDAASLVPVGHPQVETGFTYTGFSAGHTVTVGEALFRYAVACRFELRVSNVTDQFVQLGGSASGLVDPAAGFKYKLVDGVYTGHNRRPDVTLVGQTSLPGGAPAFRVDRAQPTGLVAWAYNLDSSTTVGGNFVASDLGAARARFTQYAASLYASRGITSAVTLFGEVYGLFPEAAGGSSALFGDAGAAYLLNVRTQLDFRVGAGFNAGRDGMWVGAGVSYRL